MLTTWGTQTKYGDYEVVGASEGKPRLLGEGSFGKTFQAMRSGIIAGREIRSYTAGKILNPDVLTNDGKRLQLFAEVEALSKLRHPNLVHYTDCGEQEGEVFYTMELCQGGDLVQLVRRFGPLPERAAALIGLQVAAGLRELHRRRMVHRDIKPSNIMLVEELEESLALGDLAARIEAHETLIRVVDFGLVNVALQDEESPHRFVGSANFASPEQIREQPVDGRSDIYSLGMTLWYLVQGGGPFMNREGIAVNDMREAFRRHLGPEEFEHFFPVRLSTPFRRLLARMVAKNSDNRFANAAELQQALRDYLIEPAGVCAEFTVTRLQGPLQESYEMGRRLSSNGPFASYAALEKHTRAAVRLSVFAKTRDDNRDEGVAGHLCELARLSHDRSRPEALLKVGAVLWATDFFAATEELLPFVSLSEILKARSAAKRPILFSEAALVLEPVAQGLDFLLDHRQESIFLRSEDIWVGSGEGAIPADAGALTRPLGEWKRLQIRFSPMCLAPEGDSADSCFADKSTGSLQLTADELHPIPAFARLVYRIVNGSELAAVVRFTPEAYTPAVQLTAASNTLIRDLVCGQKRAANVGSVLKELLANEAVLRAPVLTRSTVLIGAADGSGTASVAGFHTSPEVRTKPIAEAGRGAPAAFIPRVAAGNMLERVRQLGWKPAAIGLAACAAVAFFVLIKERRAERPRKSSLAAVTKATPQRVSASPTAVALATPSPAEPETPAAATPAPEAPLPVAATAPAATPLPRTASSPMDGGPRSVLQPTGGPAAAGTGMAPYGTRTYSPGRSESAPAMRPMQNSAAPALGAHANIPTRQSPSAGGAIPHY